MRLRIAVSKKLGDSVDRNRVKRVLKEAFWSQVDRDTLEQDIVIVARPGVGVHGDLREQGIAVRRCDTFPGLDESWIRIAVRSAAPTRLLLDALSKSRSPR